MRTGVLGESGAEIGLEGIDVGLGVGLAPGRVGEMPAVAGVGQVSGFDQYFGGDEVVA